MVIRIIHEDEKTVVKEVRLYGKFLYTVTYIKNNGFCIKMIRVYKDGTIEIQE